MVVLGGNMRLKALKELKYKEVPIIIADELSEDQQKEFLIKDNLGYGEWDWDMIANEWDLPMLEDWGMDLPTDFTTQEELEAVEDDFDIPDEVQTDIVVGDLFEIGEHRLLCGDSTDSDAVETLMNGEKYDLIITDPPYNVALGMETKEQAKARNRRTDGLIIQNDKMSDSDFVKFLTDYFTTTLLSTKKGGGIYVFFADMELRSFVDAFLDGGFKLSQQLIWLKQTMVMGRKDYHCKHEPILYGWYEGEAHNWYSDRKQTTILEFDRPQRNGEHPTMKPIKLIEYLMTNSSKEGDLIGDGFLGSGSTMVASHQLKRKCYGMELDPKYCQVIIDRMIKLDPTIKIKKNGKPYAKPH
jgi:site-specific DNA-methyltransferase (adenine-specific)